MTDAAAPATFEALEADVMATFGEADYGGALALLDAHAGRFPANRANELYLRTCIHARRGDADAATTTLRSALDDGLWYAELILRESPSLQPLQGDPAFEALATAFAARPPADARATTPEVRRPDGDVRGLLVAIHGNGQSARHAADAWSPLVEAGWIVAAPFSSQMLHSAAAVWDDATVAREDVARQAPAIRGLARPGAPIVLAGFSLGGDVALWAALSRTVPSTRALIIGPAAFLPDDPAWPELTASASALRALVMLGTDDGAVSADAVRHMVESLQRAGASVELELIEGLAHAYPPIERRRQAVEMLAGS